MAHLARSTISTGPSAFRPWEGVIGLLKQGEAGDFEAALGVDLLTIHVSAVVAEKSHWQANGEGIGRVRGAMLAIRPGEFPNVAAARDAILSGDHADKFDWTHDGIAGGRPLVSRAKKARAERSAP